MDVLGFLSELKTKRGEKIVWCKRTTTKPTPTIKKKVIVDNNMSKERRQTSSANKMMLRFSYVLYAFQPLHHTIHASKQWYGELSQKTIANIFKQID